MTQTLRTHSRRRVWVGLAIPLFLTTATQAQTPGPTAPALPSPSTAPAFTPAPNASDAPLPTIAPIAGPPPQVSLRYQTLHAAMNGISVTGARLGYGGMLTVNAPHLTGDPSQGLYDFSGGAVAHANDTTLSARDLQYATKGLGSFLVRAQNARVLRRPFFLRAAEIDLTPTEFMATDAHLTTAKPDEKPDLELRVSKLTLRRVLNKQGVDTGREHFDLRGASLYLLHNHLLTIRRFQGVIGRVASSSSADQPHPTFGYSGRYGAFVGYGSSTKVGRSLVRYNLDVPLRNTPQVSLSATQTFSLGPRIRPQVPVVLPNLGDPLDELRLLTTAPPLPLPDGDPLLFHDYLPGGNLIPLFNQPSAAQVTLEEQTAYHVPTEGNRMDNLFVTRYPELTMTGSVPLMHPYGLPAPGDPAAFRDYLRRPVLYAEGILDAGRFSEEPTDTDAGRLSATAGLYTRPLLVGPNTVLLPSITRTINRYTVTSQKYDYTQYSVALTHYYSVYSAIGLRYIGSSISGHSPFNFDTLDSSRELDARFQVGNRHVTYGSGIAYDFVGHHVIDYTISVAPALHGFTPVFSYQFFSRSLGVGFTIPGLTF